MAKDKNQPAWIIGVDEVGRGPLAGPVYVGAVAVPVNYDFSIYDKLRDSKKMTEKQREAARETLKREVASGNIFATCGSADNTFIDERGIVSAIESAVDHVLRLVMGGSDLPTATVMVRLDGGLRAPERFTSQETVTGGDASEPVISLAAVLAKVERDRLMVDFGQKYPKYGFARHKGYGTKEHLSAIQRHGMCEIHRESFCKNT